MLLHVLTSILLKIDKLLYEGTILLKHLIAGACVLLDGCIIIEPFLASALKQTQLILRLSFFRWHYDVPAIVRLLLLVLFELLHVLGTYVVFARAFVVDRHDALVHTLSLIVVVGCIDYMIRILRCRLAVVLWVQLLA